MGTNMVTARYILLDDVPAWHALGWRVECDAVILGRSVIMVWRGEGEPVEP